MPSYRKYIGMSLGEVIWAARKAKRMSLREVAQALGVSAAAVSQWENDGVKPTANNRAALASLLSIDPASMLELLIDERDSVATSSNQLKSGGAAGGVRALDRAGEHVLGVPLPVFNMRFSDGITHLSDEATDEEIRPAFAIKVKNAFGVLVYGDDMKPAYEAGDRVLIYPDRPVYPGRDVLLLTADRQAKLRRLLEISDTHWMVQQWNPPKREKLPRSEWPQALWIESVRRR